MTRYRNKLPQLNGDLFITDGGIETTLISRDGYELPEFAAFTLLDRPDGTQSLRRYYRSYADVARRHGVGFILESATWRASADWAPRVGYSLAMLDHANRRSIELLLDIREEYADRIPHVVISGCIGPGGDGYNPSFRMTASEAEQYHSTQAWTFRGTDADQITAITMTYAEEAIGRTRAARDAGMPVVISFTTETDGRLPSGQPLREAVEQVDEATGGAPTYFMINCAHPTHFQDSLVAGEPWTKRVRGLRANASCMSHDELDNAEELDEGNPFEFGAQHTALRDSHAHCNVFGGCCGTDTRHVEETCRRCVEVERAA